MVVSLMLAIKNERGDCLDLQLKWLVRKASSSKLAQKICRSHHYNNLAALCSTHAYNTKLLPTYYIISYRLSK